MKSEVWRNLVCKLSASGGLGTKINEYERSSIRVACVASIPIELLGEIYKELVWKSLLRRLLSKKQRAHRLIFHVFIFVTQIKLIDRLKCLSPYYVTNVHTGLG